MFVESLLGTMFFDSQYTDGLIPISGVKRNTNPIEISLAFNDNEGLDKYAFETLLIHRKENLFSGHYKLNNTIYDDKNNYVSTQLFKHDDTLALIGKWVQEGTIYQFCSTLTITKIFKT